MNENDFPNLRKLDAAIGRFSDNFGIIANIIKFAIFAAVVIISFDFITPLVRIEFASPVEWITYTPRWLRRGCSIFWPAFVTLALLGADVITAATAFVFGFCFCGMVSRWSTRNWDLKARYLTYAIWNRPDLVQPAGNRNLAMAGFISEKDFADFYWWKVLRFEKPSRNRPKPHWKDRIDEAATKTEDETYKTVLSYLEKLRAKFTAENRFETLVGGKAAQHAIRRLLKSSVPPKISGNA